jgi:transposase
VTTHSLYGWIRKFGKQDVVQRTELDLSAEIRRLKSELRRVTEERDILEKAAAYFAKG